MNRTDRLLAIMLELQNKKWQRAEDLAETFEVTKRTIYRDMLALMESGVPVVSSPGQGYSLVEGYFLPPLSFTTDEAIILLLGSDYMVQNFDAQYQMAATSAGKKIRAVLSEKLRDEVDDLEVSMRFIALNPVNEDAKPEVLFQLRRAIIQRRTVRINYQARYSEEKEQTIREVDPYALVHLDRGWYLTGYCHLRRDRRYFRLDRIDRLQFTGAVFERPEDFRIALTRTDEDRALVVRVMFDPSIARWVQEDRSFYVVQMDEHPDGLLATFQVRKEDELIQWLLGWGAKARVLEPESLKQRLVEEAQALLRLYGMPESLLT